MINRKFGAALGLALGLTGITSTASAQWSAMPTPTNASGAFWDNKSDDGTICNIGYVLSGTPTASDCNAANQRPSGWLPFLGEKPAFYLGAGNSVGFLFGAGSYRISQLGSLSLGGDIAAVNNKWGVFEVGGPLVQIGGAGSPDINQVISFNKAWGFWIDLSRPTGETAYSNVASSGGMYQAALFSFAETNVVGGTVQHVLNSKYYVGLENNACVRSQQGAGCSILTDKDYNDALISITAVPEPSTYALMAAGLAGLMAVARRRRRMV